MGHAVRKRRYNKVDSWTRMHPDANAEAPDIEELVRLGSAGGPCPFYLSRDMASTADIVFMPYNYLVDAKIRGGLKMVHWPNAVLVFDEAHNVEVIGPSSSPLHSFVGSAPCQATCMALTAMQLPTTNFNRLVLPAYGAMNRLYATLQGSLSRMLWRRGCARMLRHLT